MMNDDDDFSDAKNFVQEDEEEGKVDEVDETDQKIAVEHGIFKEKEARRWEARPGSAPPLMSPRPETIRQREEERLAAAGNPPPSGSRNNYVPPERTFHAGAEASMSYLVPPRPMSADSASSRRLSQASGIKPAAGLQNILEDRPLQESGTSVAGSTSDRHMTPETPKKGGDEAGEWVVDVEEDEEEAEVVKEDGEGEEGDQGSAYSEDGFEDGVEEEEEIAEDEGSGVESEELVGSTAAASQGKAPIIVVPTGTGRSPSPDVGRKLGGYDQGNNDLEDSEDLFEDDEGSDPLDDSSVRGSEATTDFGEVLHPHNFALQLLTHDLRALPDFQQQSEGQAVSHTTQEVEGSKLGHMGYLGMSSGPMEEGSNGDNQAKLVAASAAAIIAASQPPHGKSKKSGGTAGTGGAKSSPRGGRPISAPPVRPWSASPGRGDAGKSKGVQAWGPIKSSKSRPLSAMPSQGHGAANDDARSESSELDTGMSALLQASRVLRQSTSARDQMGGAPGKPPLSPYSSPQIGNPGDQVHWDTASTSSLGETGDIVPMLPPSKYGLGTADWQRSTYNGADVRGSSSRPWTAPGGGRSRSNRPESARPGTADHPQPILRFARPHSAHPTAGFHRKTWDGNTSSPLQVAVSESVRLTAAVPVGGLPVSVYVADTMKRILQANKWLASVGSTRRYRLKNPNSNMDIQVYDVEDVVEDSEGATTAPTLRNIPLKQFLTAHARLKIQQNSDAAAAAAHEARIRHNSEGAASMGRWEYRRSTSSTAGPGAGPSRPFSASPNGKGGAAPSGSAPPVWSPQGSSAGKSAGGRPMSARPASGIMGAKGSPSRVNQSNTYHVSRTFSGREDAMAMHWEEGEDEEVEDTGELEEFDNGHRGHGGAASSSNGSMGMEQLQAHVRQSARNAELLAAEVASINSTPVE